LTQYSARRSLADQLQPNSGKWNHTVKSPVTGRSGIAVETPLRAATTKIKTEERMMAVFEKNFLGVE